MSDIAHYDGLVCWGPFGSDRLDAVLDQLQLRRGERILDVGCGPGEALARCGERFGVGGVGVDRSSHALARARERLAHLDGFALLEGEADELHFEDGSFDAAIWLGGPFLGGSFPATLQTLVRWTRPGGALVVGHGIWIAPPPEDYLRATGLDPGELGTHEALLQTAADLGLVCRHFSHSTRDEWDAFEGRIHDNVERYARDNLSDPDPQGRLQQRRRWHAAQQQWGREVMGFGLYVFATP